MTTAEKGGMEEIMKDKYAEFRIAAAQIKQLQEQLQAVEEKKEELEEASAGLSKLKGVKKGSRMLAPISGGMFVKAAIESTNELIVNIGSNVCVKKTVDEATEMLNEKLVELMKYQEDMLEELNRLTDHAGNLEKELGEMLKEEQ